MSGSDRRQRSDGLIPRHRRRLGRSAAAALAVLALLGPLAPPGPVQAQTEDAAADRQRSIQEELVALRDQLDEAVATEANVLAEYRVVQRRRADLDAEVAALSAAVAQARAEVAAGQAALDAAAAELTRAQARYESTRRRLNQASATLRDRAVAAYVGSTNVSSIIEAFVEVEDLGGFSASTAYLRAVLDAQADEVERHRVLADAQRDVAEALDAAKAEAVARRDELIERQATLEAGRSSRATAAAGAAVEAAREAELLDDARAHRATYEARIASLQAESDSIAAFLRRLQTDHDFGGDGSLINPLPSGRLTSTYGPRRHPIYGTTRTHTGIDLAAPTGTPIIAAAAGLVVWSGYRGGYGNTVIIDHGGSMATLYAHQSSLSVAEGSVVAVGDTVGLVGSTGYSTGPHLHFEVRIDGNPVDPMPYL